MARLTFALLAVALAADTANASQTVCKGDTRGDSKCNHNPTHRN